MDMNYGSSASTFEQQLVIESMTPAQVINAKVIHYVDQYQGFARKTAQSLIALASTLVEAEAALDPVEFGEFCRLVRIEMGGSTYKKMMIIGRAAPRFEPVMDQLPNAWTTLYELAKLKSEPFDKLVTGKQIHPLMTGREVRSQTDTEVRASPAADEPFLRLAEIKIASAGASQEMAEAIIDALKKALEPFSPDTVKLALGYGATSHDGANITGDVGRRKASEAKHLAQVEAWLLRSLRASARPKSGVGRAVPFTALKIIDALGLPIEILDGPTEALPKHPHIPLWSLLQPTMPQFIAALSREFLEKAGAHRFLAVVSRAQRLGDWREVVTVVSAGKRRKVPKMELDLRDAQAAMKDADSKEERAAARERVAEIVSYLPPKLAALSADQQQASALDWI